MKIVYLICVQAYFFVIRIASLFNNKAKLMIAGRKNWAEILRQKINPNERYIWFHVASLGEFEQGRTLIERYHAENKKIILTFFSPSGYEIRKNYDKADIVCYLPFDSPKNAKTFVNIVKPEFAIFVKYEFWYYFICQLAKQNVPTYLVSGIFRKGQIFFRPWGKFYRKVLTCFSWLFVQDENSRHLLNNIGINNITVCGDTRVDRVYKISHEPYQNEFIEEFVQNSKVLVCGSTWLPDEKIISQYINSHSDYKAIIVPHEIHEEHLQAIEKLLTKPACRLSKIESANLADTTYIIVDSIGLLSKIYRFGQIAYIGGGFGVGIHNTLEAVVYNIPVIFGPNYKKFKEAHDLIRCQAGFTISSYNDLEHLLTETLADVDFYHNSQLQAENYINNSLHASDIIYDKI